MWLKLLEAALPLIIAILTDWYVDKPKREKRKKLQEVGKALVNEDVDAIAIFLEGLDV